MIKHIWGFILWTGVFSLMISRTEAAWWVAMTLAAATILLIEMLRW